MPSALEKLRQIEEGQRAPVDGGAAPPPRRRQGVVAAIVAVAGFLLLKGKWFLLFLVTKGKLLFGAVKLGQLLTTAYTMALSAWAYAFYYGWPFAAGLVLLILIHEIGHGMAAARVGVRVGAPMFVPFVGAFIALRDRPRSTSDEAVIAAGGPIVGAAAATLTVAVSLSAGEPADLLRVVGFYALVLNLFNLTPVWQLDGARMLAPVGPRATLIGAAIALAALIGAAVHAGHLNPIALIAVAVCAFRGGSRWWHARRAAWPTSLLERAEKLRVAATAIPDEVPPRLRLRAALVYFGALIALTLAVHALHAELPALD